MAQVARNRQSLLLASAIAASVIALYPSPSRGQGWQEAKDTLTQHGITPSLTYDGDVASNVTGGAKRGTTYLGNLHFQLSLDGEKLATWPGMMVFLDGMENHGGQPSAFAGDAQGVSNIAAPPGFKLYEAWLQYNFLGLRLSVLGGLYDLNSEFYRLQSAGLFLNSSFGIGPEFALSGVGGPSIFPNTAIGVRFAYKPAPNIVFRAAVLDGVPLYRSGGAVGAFERGDGLLISTEAAFVTRPAPDKGPTSQRFRIGRASGLPPYDDKIAIGAWYYTAKFNDLSEVSPGGQPTQRHGSGGAYLIGDRLLYRSENDPAKRLTAFLQAGIGDDRIDRFGSYIGSGLTATGFIAGRPSDEMGLGVAVARNGSHYSELQTRQMSAVNGSEIALELTYLGQVTNWLALQPNAQYVIHPNTNPSVKNALVFQFQVEMSF